MDSEHHSSSSKCNLLDGDDEFVQWRRILDLNSAANIQTDWYSTRTFQHFLDALDINQPVSSEDKSNRLNSTNKTKIGSGKIKTELEENIDSVTIKEECATAISRYQGVETILSAEALKILSELPDLSHMSATRTFIFPNGRGDKKRT